jgi:hypothetical protein
VGDGVSRRRLGREASSGCLSYGRQADISKCPASAIAKGIGRSSGATANCLVRLTNEKKVRQVRKKPRAYALKGGSG